MSGRILPVPAECALVVVKRDTRADEQKVDDRYPTLGEVGEEMFCCPIARLYVVTLASLAGTVAFRNMTPFEIHDEMVRGARETEGIEEA